MNETPPRTGPSRRPALTGRALTLGALLVLAIVLLAAPLHRYLGSRSDVSHAAQQLRDDRGRLGALTREKTRLADPGYIEQLARNRLQYAMPGDTVYVVVDKGQRSNLEQTSGPGRSVKAASATWTTRLWDSVLDAGR